MKTLKGDRGPNPRILTDSDGKRYEVVAMQSQYIERKIILDEGEMVVKEIKNEMPEIKIGYAVQFRDGNKTYEGTVIRITPNQFGVYIFRRDFDLDRCTNRGIIYYDKELITEVYDDKELIWQRN